MTPEQARFFLDFHLPRLDEEFSTTKKVIAAIPEDHRDYRPDPKARTAVELAWHIVSVDVWFLDGIADGQFAMDGFEEAGERTIAEIVAWYDEHFSRALERVKALTDDALVHPITFFGPEERPVVFYITYLTHHSVHHRGQLTTYLRPMGSTIPSVYGGSADEPFDPAAHGMEAAQ